MPPDKPIRPFASRAFGRQARYIASMTISRARTSPNQSRPLKSRLALVSLKLGLGQML
jgi:hypothetical protein